MRSNCPLQIEYIKLIQIEYILCPFPFKPKSILINSRHYYTLDWLENHSMLKRYYTDYTEYTEYYKRYCYV